MSSDKPYKPEIIDLGKGQISFDQLPIRGIVLAVLVLIIVGWFLTSGPIYTVEPQEVGIVQTFGKYSKTTLPGLHFKVPWPVQQVTKVPIQQVWRIEIGFRSNQQRSGTTYSDFTDSPNLLLEAQMLTGDENVVNCSMAVQYRIKEARDYLFNFARGEADSALKDIAEAALRQAVGDHPIDAVLTEGKSQVRLEIQERMQLLADAYGMGISITEVQLQDVKPPREVEQAFQSVASARERREELINRARAYESQSIPKAEGEARRMLLEAEGYNEAQVQEAHGDVARFLAIIEEFEQAPEVTRARLYLEALEELLPKIRLTVIDENAGIVNLKTLGGAPMPSVAQPQGDVK